MISSVNASDVFYSPYSQEKINTIYNLLYCDDLPLFKNAYEGEPTGSWYKLFSDAPELSSIEKIARNEDEESRVRVLAYNLLSSKSKQITDKKLLGVIRVCSETITT